MDKRAKDKLVRSPRGNGGGQDAQKRSSLKNWKGREEGKRWKEEVERDPQALGMRRWGELVADRKKWKDIVRQAETHIGLQWQWNNNNNLKPMPKMCI